MQPERKVEHLYAEAVCTGCHKSLPVSEFRKDRAKPRGRSTRCKECSKEAMQARADRNAMLRAEAIAHGHKKVCKDCGEVRPIADFVPSPNCVGGSSNECEGCFLKRHKGWRDKNREHVRRKSREGMRKARWDDEARERQNAHTRKSRLKRQYGLTHATLRLLIDAQGRKCRICATPFGVKPWGADASAVDHDHRTGKVRSILCTKCNRGLGLFQDSPDLLEAAAVYLRAHARQE